MNRILYFKLSTLFFLQFFIWGSWYVTMGTYLLETLQFDGREVGLIYGTTAIAATVSPFILGSLSDRIFATEKLLSLLHFTGGLVMFWVSTFDQFLWFYPVLIFYALLYVPTFALASALSFRHIQNTSRQFPRVRVWGTVGWILVGLIISYFDLETTAVPMRISAGASLFQALFCLQLPHTPPQATQERRTLKDFLGPEVIALLQKPSFAVLIASLVLISIPSGFYYTFTNSFLTQIGVEDAAGTMSIGQGSEIILMLLMPWFFVRMSFKWIIGLGLFFWGIRYAFFAYGNAEELIWMLYLGILLHGAAYSFSFLTAQIYIDRIVPPHVKGAAQGFITLVTLGIGALIGSYIAGETVRQLTLPNGQQNWEVIWLVPTIIGLIVTVLFALFFRERTSISVD